MDLSKPDDNGALSSHPCQMARMCWAVVLFLGVAANAAAQSVTLRWDASTAAGVQGYRVYRDGSLVGSTGVAGRSYSVPVGPGTQWLGVTAIGANGVESRVVIAFLGPPPAWATVPAPADTPSVKLVSRIPPSSPPPPGLSPSGTLVPPAPRIVDSAGAVWTLRERQVERNGQSAANGVGDLILWFDGSMYVLNIQANKSWWVWVNGAWAESRDPREAGTPPVR